MRAPPPVYRHASAPLPPPAGSHGYRLPRARPAADQSAQPASGTRRNRTAPPPLLPPQWPVQYA
ncbi:ALG2-interacting protein X, partial [Corchorus olitorius]